VEKAKNLMTDSSISEDIFNEVADMRFENMSNSGMVKIQCQQSIVKQ